MPDKTKITLSAKEQELVSNKEWILTKRVIIEKVSQLFASLATSMQQYMVDNAGILPEIAISINPKISKGENYHLLPYVMLDYPRYFTKTDTLAIRTFFWWGNFFSINLHLSGNCKEVAIPALKANFTVLQKKHYFICVNAEPWHHHFEADNYLSLDKFNAEDFATMLFRQSFVKIAKQISLKQWEAVPAFLEHHFNEMMLLLQFNFQVGERDPLPGTPKAGFDL